YRVKREGIDFVLDETSLANLGLDSASALLVRPDGHIAAQLTDEVIGGEQLRDALRTAVAKYPAFDDCAA
ncbi:MAG: hypothetical protein AAGI44_19510, partial [Pseudomonadota bacterium]